MSKRDTHATLSQIAEHALQMMTLTMRFSEMQSIMTYPIF